MYSLVATIEVLKDEPSSVSFTITCKERTKWLDEMNEEMKSLLLNNNCCS